MMEIQCRLIVTAHNKNNNLEQAMKDVQEYFQEKQMATTKSVEISYNTTIEDISVEDLIGEQ